MSRIVTEENTVSDLPRKNVRNVQGFNAGSSSTLMTRVTRSSAVVTTTLCLLPPNSSPSYVGKSLTMPSLEPSMPLLSILSHLMVSLAWNSLGNRVSTMLVRRLESSASTELDFSSDIVALIFEDMDDATTECNPKTRTDAQSYPFNMVLDREKLGKRRER